ncbi:Probable helicase MAGATAMA 3 [Linum grandiflorum]
MTVIFLKNITTTWRVWNALHRSGNLNIINKVLSEDTLDGETCSLCYNEMDTNQSLGSSNLNESQKAVVMACLRTVHCSHKTGLELLKGPPGTGKTSTVSTLLVTLLKMECRTLACTPTDVAIKEVAHRLSCESVHPNELEQLFTFPDLIQDSSHCFAIASVELSILRTKCLSALEDLGRSLENVNFPSDGNKYAIQNFCFQTASLIFCTTSSSYKLQSMGVKPLEVLVIDEAAQMKECESMIPLQLPGIRHALLIGDECKLPAMVRSKASREAGFRRSMFERLTSLQHHVHLLNIQYRMHPSISYFPNLMFYSGTIQDGDNVRSRNYQKYYLLGPMFGPYSFMNVNDGREELNNIGNGVGR